MKDMFLRPLLTRMGILGDYECVGDGGHWKIDVVGADTELGQHYRRGIVEYFGMNNVDTFLTHFNNTVADLQDANVDRAFRAGVGDFVGLVEEARAHAPVVDAGESVLVQEPFEDFFALVYPCYLEALCSDGYYLSDLELLLLCECARLNAVIVREVREERGPAFQLHKCVLPAGDSGNVTVISINAGIGRSAVRGHYERLECVSRDGPPPGELRARDRSSTEDGAAALAGRMSGE
eukprot:9467105-Pyramimonas_sp.AAC.1